MFDVFFDKANELNAQGRPFALAIVVRNEPPISGKPGDKAIIQPDGHIFGWIGGGCTQPIIVKEAREALAEGTPRLVRITPRLTESPNGVTEYAMTCHSGGTLDIYIEPVLPKPHLVILGHSVVARTLARLGKVLDYHVTAVAPEADEALFPEADALHTRFELGALRHAGPTFVVVSTQGEHDEAALSEVLRYDFLYAAFVASRKKAEHLFRQLRDHGAPAARLDRIKVPAGLDIQARTSEEIAVSILAEIIQVMRSAMPAPQTVEKDVPAGAQTETLAIEDMTCQHCVHTVGATLEKIDGVVVHHVEIGAAQISYDPARVDRLRIVEALTDRGYAVQGPYIEN